MPRVHSPHPAKATLSPHPMRGEGRVRGVVGHSRIGFIPEISFGNWSSARAEIGLPARDHFFLNKSPRFLVALLRLSVDPLPAFLSRSAVPFLPSSTTAFSAAGIAACNTYLRIFA